MFGFNPPDLTPSSFSILLFQVYCSSVLLSCHLLSLSISPRAISGCSSICSGPLYLSAGFYFCVYFHYIKLRKKTVTTSLNAGSTAAMLTTTAPPALLQRYLQLLLMLRFMTTLIVAGAVVICHCPPSMGPMLMPQHTMS